MNAAKATANWVLANKLWKVKTMILDELRVMVHNMGRNNDHSSLLRKFHRSAYHHLRDLQSWPTSPKMNVATRRIQNILDVLNGCFKEIRHDPVHPVVQNIPLMRVRIILKARHIG